MANRENIKVMIDGFAAIATFLGIIIGVYQFNRQQAINIETEQKNHQYNESLEFRRKNWESQQQIYLNIVEAAGTIASEFSKAGEKDSAIARFKALYYGKAAFVEDSTVAITMRKFADDIQDFKGNFLNENRLKSSALTLVQACKLSSAHTWNVLSN